MRSSLDRLSLEGFEFGNVRLILAQILSASSFTRPFTAYSTVAMISLLGSVLEANGKLRPSARRSVATRVNCLEGMTKYYGNFKNCV